MAARIRADNLEVIKAIRSSDFREAGEISAGVCNNLGRNQPTGRPSRMVKKGTPMPMPIVANSRMIKRAIVWDFLDRNDFIATIL